MRQIAQDLSLQFFTVEHAETTSAIAEFFTHNLSRTAQGKEFIDFIPREDAPQQSTDCTSLITRMHDILSDPQPGSSIEIKYLCTRLLTQLNNPDLYHTNPVTLGSTKENELFNDIYRLMEQADGRISRARLEEELHYSATYLNRIVKKYTGLSLFNFGMTFCMKYAAELLEDTSMSVTEIAQLLQFGNRSNFYTQFTRAYNMTPAQYRAAYRAQTGNTPRTTAGTEDTETPDQDN